MNEGKMETVDAMVTARLEVTKRVLEATNPEHSEQFELWGVEDERAMELTATLVCEIPGTPKPRAFAYAVALSVDDFLKLDDWKKWITDRIAVDLLNDVKLILGFLAQSGVKGAQETLDLALHAGTSEDPTPVAENEEVPYVDLIEVFLWNPADADDVDRIGFARGRSKRGGRVAVKRLDGSVYDFKAGEDMNLGMAVCLKPPNSSIPDVNVRPGPGTDIGG